MRWLRSDTEPSSNVLLVRNCLHILTLGDRKVSLHPYYREQKCTWEVGAFDLKSDSPEGCSGAGTLGAQLPITTLQNMGG